MSDTLSTQLQDEARLAAELGALLVDINKIELSKNGTTFTLSTTRNGETKSISWHDGTDGKDGKDGRDGVDGYTPQKGVDYFDGADGHDGWNGRDGQDGYTPVKGVDYFDGVDGQNGQDGRDGVDGKDGTPVRGTTPPEDKTRLWVDTNDSLTDDDEVNLRFDKAQNLTTTQKQTVKSNIGLPEDIVGKLSEPSSGLAVGKYFRIASIDASGHAVLEACDAPATDVQINGTSITQDGVANIPYIRGDYHTAGLATTGNGYGIDVGGANNNLLYVSAANNANISGRNTPYKPIVPNNLDYAVKAAMCDGVGAAWSATEQAAARSRMGIDKEWVLKGTISGDETDRGNIDTGVSVDLTGCTELFMYGSFATTSTNAISAVFGNGSYRSLTNSSMLTSKVAMACRHVDFQFGVECLYSKYAGGTYGVLNTLADGVNGFMWVDGKHIADISALRILIPNAITKCNIKIYAR